MGFNKQQGEQLYADELNSFYSAAGLYGESSAGSDDYAITVNPVPASYEIGDSYMFKADVANTGPATLNVNGLGAKTLKKSGNLDLNTNDIRAGQICRVTYDGTYFQLTSSITIPSFFYQEVAANVDAGTTDEFQAVAASSDGTVVITLGNTADATLTRFERDANTGMYRFTHRNTELSAKFTGASNGLVILGNYIYIFWDAGVNAACYRYDLADLTNETSMSFSSPVPAGPGGELNNGIKVFAQDGYIYVQQIGVPTTYHKLSVSGAAFTTVTTVTVNSNLNSSNGFWVDDAGTTYSVRDNGAYIDKITSANGATVSTTTINMKSVFDGASTGSCLAGIDSTRIYLIQTRWRAETGSSNNRYFYLAFTPITKP